jgi:UrcA family protein
MTTAKFATHYATLLSAVAASLLFSSAVHAADATNITASRLNSITVNYRDLNLATNAGHEALKERITVAARKVCAPSDIRDLDGVAASESCQRAAVSRALFDVSSAHPAAQYAVNLTRR